jgi:two-component system OmpR family response regulator
MSVSNPSPDQAVVLVVDDDEAIASLVRMALETSGFAAISVNSAKDARHALTTQHVDLVILDVLLGDANGFTLLEELRHQGHSMPVLFLTALGELPDKLRGLSLGDDYMSKPFMLEEIVARVNTLLRRRGDNDHRLIVGDLILNEDTISAQRGGEDITLTPTEFNLLRLLMRNHNRVVARSEILNEVWSPELTEHRANVDTYISYLRKKIDGDRPVSMIVTSRGFGYRIRPVS